MGQHLFYGSLPVVRAGENGDSRGPHHCPHGDQIDVGQSQPGQSVEPLRHGISHESGVGAEGGETETVAFALRGLPEEQAPVDDAKEVKNQRNPQQDYTKQLINSIPKMEKPQ